MLKFIERGSQINKNGSEVRRRGVCFLISVIFHTLFIYLLFNIKFEIKIFPDKEVVREVVLVSPEKIFIPENIKNFVKSFSEKGIKNDIGFLDYRVGSKVEIDQILNQVKRKNIKDKTDNLTFKSDIPLRFELGLPSRFKPDLPPDYKLDLSLKPEKKENIFIKINKSKVKKDLNLSKYLYSDFSKIRLAKTSPYFGRYSPGNTPQGGRASFDIRDYDIAPWAEKVVNKIQKNWIVPPTQKTSAKCLVVIFVIIEKSGELSSVEIVNSSKVQLLDQAALKALNLSSPFPPLPDDFPNKNLEAYFEFLYND